MKIVSKTHTHDMGPGRVYPPDTVFDCPAEAARRKIEAGTAREADEDDSVVALQQPGKTENPTGTGGAGDDTGGAGDDTGGAGDDTSPEPPTGNERADAIVEACLELDENNKELFTGSGAPTTKALSEEVGFEVSAAERDVAWAEVQDDGDGS